MDLKNIVENIGLIFNASDWLVKNSMQYPEIFKWVFFILFFLALIALWNGISYLKKWYNNRKLLFESILESRYQAISHQDTIYSTEHALRPHKEQKIKLISDRLELLPRIDPLRKKSQLLVNDLKSVNSFDQSEKVTQRFLDKYNL